MADTVKTDKFPKHVREQIGYMKELHKKQLKAYDDMAWTFRYIDTCITNGLIPKEFRPHLSSYLRHTYIDVPDGEGGTTCVEVWQATVNVRVKSFKDVLPVLEQLSSVNLDDYQFTKTEDHPDWSERVYSSKRIRVEARLEGEGVEGCRREVVGYKAPSTDPIPIYEFKCD